MMDEMCAALGGRAAEDVIFGKVSTGALSDLEKVTKQAYSMVMYYGLNDKIGNLSYYDSTGSYDSSFHKPYSEKTAELFDIEVRSIVETAYAHSKNILEENKEKLTKLAKALLEKEVIFKEDLEEIFGKRPFEKPENLPTPGTTPSNGTAAPAAEQEKNSEEGRPENPVSSS